MTATYIVNENQLDEWVRGNARNAQGLIVELVWRLVAASAPNPKARRFPLGDSIGQPGPDGILDTDLAFPPFVPEGQSLWEIGTGIDARAKAMSDYADRTANTPLDVRSVSTFVFVTPLSGRRDWPHVWKGGAQASWIQERRERNEWRDVRAIDGSILIDWLHHFPAVEQWLAGAMGLPVLQMQTPEQRWSDLRTIGAPPPLTPEVFLANRSDASDKLKEIFSKASVQLKLDTRYPGQVADFVAAYVAAMSEDAKVDAASRCLIISGSEGWSTAVTLRDSHVFVADFDLDDADATATKLIEKARRAGHAVIFGGMPGGIPHPNRASIPDPKPHQLQDALEKAGYKEERARMIAQKTGGNLTSLLRCLQNLSVMPEWAQQTNAADLAIAELLGAWTERSEADKGIAELLSKKAYGEWIGTMREVTLRKATPLTQHDGLWKIVARYEGWYALGPQLFDEQLDLARAAAVRVLRERDPQFDLPKEERFAASIHGKVLTHSPALRKGLAESLALLGSHPKALTSCSIGKAEATALLAVREILADADWVLWASLNSLLPLLAEAAPGEFLDAVERALRSDPCPFVLVFEQEGVGAFGWNYMTGLLWALETLAWDPECLTRVLVDLGELATRDPGGNWANRPSNSLATILLPWLPQTCASVAKRQAAVATLIREVPSAAWDLLLKLLPDSRQMSSGSRRPAWRETIPPDWSRNVSTGEYSEQANAYCDLAVTTASNDPAKLGALIERINGLPPAARNRLLTVLGSEAISSMAEAERLPLWTALIDVVVKHRKFVDAQWAMNPEEVDRIEEIAESLAPVLPVNRFRRLFSSRDFGLYEEKGNYEEQQRQLEERRRQAIIEVLRSGGIETVLRFAESVEAPWRVGIAFGAVAQKEVEAYVLPPLLECETKPLAQLAGGYVWGRFATQGWQWATEMDLSEWLPSQKGQFLAYLPFTPETWGRASQLLGKDESSYWSRASVNPYQATGHLEVAIDRLVCYGRPHAAVQCVEKLVREQSSFDPALAIRVLQALLGSSEGSDTVDADAIVEIVRALQGNPTASREEVARVEWAFLPLLREPYRATPKVLEQQLARHPDFFCEVLRMVFRSKSEERRSEELTEQQKNLATNAYRLLSQWATPPGMRDDGTYDADALNAWLSRANALCQESGHLDVGLQIIGHVLVHAPADPDGLWIHHAAAEALNSQDAEQMRQGFKTELFNSRGPHWVDPEGREERQLAAKFRTKAEAVEMRGYHRLANSLRELAASYDREAERAANSKYLDD
jgi:hypothetical protein